MLRTFETYYLGNGNFSTGRHVFYEWLIRDEEGNELLIPFNYYLLQLLDNQVTYCINKNLLNN